MPVQPEATSCHYCGEPITEGQKQVLVDNLPHHWNCAGKKGRKEELVDLLRNRAGEGIHIFPRHKFRAIMDGNDERGDETGG